MSKLDRRKHGLKPHSKKARKILRRLEAEERQAVERGEQALILITHVEEPEGNVRQFYVNWPGTALEVGQVYYSGDDFLTGRHAYFDMTIYERVY